MIDVTKVSSSIACTWAVWENMQLITADRVEFDSKAKALAYARQLARIKGTAVRTY